MKNKNKNNPFTDLRDADELAVVAGGSHDPAVVQLLDRGSDAERVAQTKKPSILQKETRTFKTEKNSFLLVLILYSCIW